MAEFGQELSRWKWVKERHRKWRMHRKASEMHKVSAQTSASLCGRSAERERRQGDWNY